MATVRADVERVKVNDANHPAGTLYPRMRAVVEANRAVLAGETGAKFAYRSALIDLAAAAEATAAELPARGVVVQVEGVEVHEDAAGVPAFGIGNRRGAGSKALAAALAQADGDDPGRLPGRRRAWGRCPKRKPATSGRSAGWPTTSA